VRVLVQHDPRRADIVGRLLDGLTGLDAELVVDPGGERPNPWRCFRACLERAGDGPATILQDDATVCRDFPARLAELVELEPAAVLCLFCSARPYRTAVAAQQARARGDRFAPVHARDWLPVVGITLPAGVSADILRWCEQTDRRGRRVRETRSDDHMLGLWHKARGSRYRALVTVPSLVQHPDDVPSLIGNRAARGRNLNRVALFYDGE
jgi:hypothetical protein